MYFSVPFLILIAINWACARGGGCTSVTGVIVPVKDVLLGCEYPFTVEFCPIHKKDDGEWVNSITVKAHSNMTKGGFVSTCALRVKVFSSVVSSEFQTAASATRYLNMTTLEGTYRSSMLYSVLNRPEHNETSSKLQFLLHINFEDHPYPPTTVDFKVDPDNGEVSFLGAFSHLDEAPQIQLHDRPTQIVKSEAEDLKLLSKKGQQCDFNDLLSGQWTFDRAHKTYKWRTHTCDSNLISVESFIEWCKKYELKSLLFIGTSRTRTFVFDLMYFFGYSQTEILSVKVHNHLTYNVEDKLGYDLTIHYHWNDCKPDRQDRRMPSYDHYLANLQKHFSEINICTHPSSVSFRVPDNFVHVASNVDYTSANYTSHSYANITQPYAVFFSSGICETEFVGVEPFKAHMPSVVKYVYESCMGAIPTAPLVPDSTERAPSVTENANIFFVKLEEVVDPALHFFDALNDANYFMLNTVVADLNVLLHTRALPPITVLDMYHVTRSWKLFEPRKDIDRMHYYAEHVYHGNHVSNTAMNMILHKVAQTMESNLMRKVDSSPKWPEYDRYRSIPSSDLFPAYSALPGLITYEVARFEGRLLQNPHNRREIFFMHEGVKRPIPDWDTYVALNMSPYTVVYLGKGEFDAIPSGPPLPNAG